MKKLVIVGLLIAAAGGGWYWQASRVSAQPTIVTQPLTRGSIVEAVSATGTLEAVETVQIGTQVSGIVSRLYADFNSIVKKGQLLAKLDPQLIQTQIEQQEANVARAAADVERLKVNLADSRQKLERSQALASKGLIPQSDLDAATLDVRNFEAQVRSADAGVTQARAQLNNSRVSLRYTTITSPIDGIVISRNVDQGQTVAASMNAPTLYVIANDLTRMQVVASIDESDVGRIRPGQAVSFQVDAFPSDAFSGTVSQVRLQPSVVQNVVTYSAVISAANGELKLKPGMTANVTVEVARRDNVLRVPNAALRFRPTPAMFAALQQAAPEDGRPAAGSAPRAVPAVDTTAGASAISLRKASATSIDSLFPPLSVEDVKGSAWALTNNQLERVSLRLGISDGTFTEVLNDGDVTADARVVTSIATTARTQSGPASGGTSPLLGSQPRPRPAPAGPASGGRL